MGVDGGGAAMETVVVRLDMKQVIGTPIEGEKWKQMKMRKEDPRD